jgi:signal transduction histidine kinase/ActR/RegA family two-component response regulator
MALVLRRDNEPLNTTPMNATPAATAKPARSAPPKITLIDRRATVWMYLVGFVCTAMVWAAEAHFHQVAAHDRFAYPALLTVFATLGLFAWKRPERATLAQGLGSLTISLYFIFGVAYSLLITQDRTVYQLATMTLWVMSGHLLFFITWPPRSALLLSSALTLLTAMPAVWITVSGDESPLWQETLWPLYVNGVVAQTFFILAMHYGTRQLRKLTALTPRTSLPSHGTLTVDDVVSLRLRDLEQARDAAETASKAKSRFLAVMSHELRTPLHGVLGAAELLRQHDLTPHERGELLDTVSRGGTHLLNLINDVLDLSRIEAGRMEPIAEPFDVQECLGRALEAVQVQAAEKQLDLQFRVAPRLPRWLLGDDFRLRQVLINLLGNAVKFTERGHVRLSADHETAPDGQGRLVLTVEDTGIGISEADRERVFEAFQQADSASTRRHGGTGLGLAIAQQLVSLMHGQLSLQSDIGSGTRVTLELPLTTTMEPETRNSSSMALATSNNTLVGVRVLLVDDDPVNTMIAEQMLVRMEAQVDIAHSGAEALDRLKGSYYDVVLMDWRMPGMDGLETTRRMREGSAGEAARLVAVIGFTANAYNEDRLACLRAGMDDVLVKPVNKLQLRLAVQRQLMPS